MVYLKGVSEIMECKCPLWKNIICLNCGKEILGLAQYYINHIDEDTRKILYQQETKCCSKKCYEQWLVETDRFESVIKTECKSLMVESLLNILDLDVKQLFLICESVLEVL